VTDTSGTDNSRLSDLVEEIQTKIEEIKATIQPAWDQMAADVKAKAQEISDTIDQKLAELGQRLSER
jgi:hypothetical protein